MRNYLSYITVSFALCLSSCITEYVPPTLDSGEGLLVVEGMICDPVTRIKLSRSVGIDSEGHPSGRGVDGAQVWIESERGERWESIEQQSSGEYVINIEQLQQQDRYRLRIRVDGQDYQSEFLSPQRTPPIDEIDFNAHNGSLQVRLNVHGEGDQSPYYLWNYEETWEIHAHQYADYYMGLSPDSYSYISLGEAIQISQGSFTDLIWPYPNPSPFYYCWKYANSQEILLGTSERLQNNELRDYVLYNIDLSDDRISYLYRTRVTQYAISKDAYFYFTNQKKNTDDTGSIFSPIPSEMRGNIVCTTSPDTPVIGFVEVSQLVEREEYFQTGGNAPYINPNHICRVETKLDPIIEENLEFAFYLFRFEPRSGDASWTNIDCIDCRRLGGQKRRPDYWPNDHI